MTEGVSMGGMMELPLVVHLAQRTGPSTGVPTYTGQADLNVALYGGHGDFLRVVIAPGDAEEAYRVTKEAFYLAEKLGLVVILLTDKHLVESVYTSQQKKNNLKIPSRKEWAGKGLFKRNSYEHDLEWNTTEEAGEIKASVERREKKRELLGREIQNFERYKIYGKGKKLLVGFGSTKGAVLDALKDLPGFGYLHLIYLEPFPEETLSILKGVEEGWVIEGNVGGQLAELIARKTGYKVDKGKRVLKYDARPFTPEEIIKKVREIKGAEGK